MHLTTEEQDFTDTVGLEEAQLFLLLCELARAFYLICPKKLQQAQRLKHSPVGTRQGCR